MGGCEGRLSVVAAVADMKGKTWGYRMDAGNIGQAVAPCLDLHVCCASRGREGDASLQTDRHPLPGQPTVHETKTPFRIRAGAFGRSENRNRYKSCLSNAD